MFDVGQARLKDGSTKVLINALVNIRARPGWLIVVTGYTDTTGNKKANQQLSLRRAEAVRDSDATDQRHSGHLFCRTGGWAKAILRQLTIRRKAGPLTGASKSVWFPALTPVRT
ncbi:OmpA family protein [Klebsiella pneumoniae subsp. pneumoniae]|nr:OmpA family protein [Klebsiella pneumoniae subsp. pneumoniae]